MYRSARRLPACSLAALVVVGLLAVPAAAQSDLAATIELDGREASSYDVNDPLTLEDDRPVEVRVHATNASAQPIVVRSVRLTSRVMGMTFLAYETRVDAEVPAGAVGEVSFELDLLDLSSQATGLLPAQVELLDSGRASLTAVPLTVDVKGALASVYGAFGLLVMLLTAFALALALFRLWTGRLPVNRWGRGLQFAAPGVGIGLELTIGLSAVRLFSPEPGLWSVLVLVCGAVAFGLGYLTPTPARDDVVDLADVDFALAPDEDPDRGPAPDADAPGSPPTQETLVASEPDGPHPAEAALPSSDTVIGPGPPEPRPPVPSRDTVAGLGAPEPEPSRPTVPGLEPPTEGDR